MQLPCEEETTESRIAEPSIWLLLETTALFLWKDWPRDMNVVTQSEYVGLPKIRLRGTCPHCRAKAVFTEPGSGFNYTEPIRREANARTYYAVLQCQACLDFLLGIVKVHDVETPNTRGANTHRVDYTYIKHYPLGTPDDSVSEDVPSQIAADFGEALRCRWVNGYNATVEMCRRVLESSCLEIGAPPKLGTLQKMIDWVHEQGKITKPLCDMAHKIRLGGDRGAHPSTRVMGEEDADAVIEFTREYLDHVYVMPAKMAKFDFSRPKKVEVKSE